MTLVLDGTIIGTYTGSTWLAGSFGLMANLANGWTVDNILVVVTQSTQDIRTHNIVGAECTVLKMEHDLDRLESRFALREK